MTATDTAAPLAEGPEAPPQRHVRRRAGRSIHRPLDWVVLAVVVLGSLALRAYRISTSYDLFIDEITYRQIGVNLAYGQGLTLYGDPFALHPPTVFVLLAGIVRSLGLDGPAVSDILTLRLGSAVVGSLAVGAAYLILRRVGLSVVVAGGAALVLATEPFQISFDSRLFLEAYAQLFLAATVLAVLAIPVVVRRGPRIALVLAAGLSGAATLTSKETFGMVLVLTLVLALLLDVVPRRPLAWVLGLSVAGYLVVAGVVSAFYGLGAWWGMRLDGLSRLLGVKQSTGFNAEGTQVSLTSRLVADLDQLVVTYVVLVVGGVAALALIWRRLRHRAAAEIEPTTSGATLLLPLWTFCACAYLGYATVFGSIEEQMYYIPLLPCLLTAALWASGWSWPRRSRLAAGVALSLLVAVPTAWDSLVWQRIHTAGNQNSYQQFMAWEPTNVPDGSKIAITDGVSQFLVKNAVVGTWSTSAELAANDVDYVLVQTKIVREGYGPGTSETVAYAEGRGRKVFEAVSGDGGSLILYEIQPTTGGAR